MSKIRSERGLESMDGDDERSDRSASPRTHVPEEVVNPRPRTRRAASAKGRTGVHFHAGTRFNEKETTTMAVDSVHQLVHSEQRSNQQVLRNVNQDNFDNNGNDKSRKRRRPRNRRKNRKWKPYTQLSWEERQQRDEEESRRASLKRANRPTPYNTTQFLMEDHKVDTPDLSSMGAFDENNDMNLSSSDELLENENDEYLMRNFTAVYDEVQSERLQQMSKEQLVNEVLELSKKVAELEDCLRPSSGGGGGGEEEADGKLSSGGENDERLSDTVRSRLESVQDLEEEVKQLKEENRQLRRNSKSKCVQE